MPQAMTVTVKRAVFEFYNVADGQVDQQIEQLRGRFFQKTGKQIGRGNQPRAIHHVRRNGGQHAGFGNVAQGLRKVFEHQQNQIKQELGEISQPHGRKQHRHEPVNHGQDRAGAGIQHKIRLEFAPAGTCFVHQTAEENVVDDVPDAVDRFDQCNVVHPDFDNVRNEHFFGTGNVETRGNIIQDIPQGLPGADIATLRQFAVRLFLFGRGFV